MTDLQQLIHVARKAGWSVHQRHGGHFCWRAPNLRASLRRAGLKLHGDCTHG